MIDDSRTMVKTIQAALSPLLTIGSICGLVIFEYPSGRSRPYLSCLYFSITWSVYGLLVYHLIFSKFNIVVSWPNIAVVVTTVITIFDSLFHSKELNVCLRKLSIVDDTLEVLGTPKQYQLLHKWIIGIVIGWMLLAVIMNAMDSVFFYYTYFDIFATLIPFFGNHLIHISTYSGLMLGTILRYTGSRFQRVNEHIYKLLQTDTKYNERWKELILFNQQRIETKDCRRRMWILMHVHLHLSDISRHLNRIFSMQLTLQIASYFAFFMDTFCAIYTWYTNKSKTLERVLDGLATYIWFAVCIIKLFGLNYICQSVSDKAHETIIILYELSNNSFNADLREQILQFTLQIKQREVKFSGMGLFYFGYDFLRKFCRSLLTLMVIIIQMRVSYNDIIQSVDNEDYISI